METTNLNVYANNLGKKSDYVTSYEPSLLDPIPRAKGRSEITQFSDVEFHGYDIWTAFELSWLNPKGKPMVAIADFKIPHHSPCLIESKSFKLYLNSFNQTRLTSEHELQEMLTKDLSDAAGAPVSVTITPVDASVTLEHDTSFTCIDGLDISIDDYEYNDDSLMGATSSDIVEEQICSHLLKSNCLVTNQPDWGTVFIKYKGKKINQETLLRYIISFRNHNEFHEQCVERIFADIKRCCQPEQLTVYARYTRRGGLDINPFRSDFESEMQVGRLPRQ